MKVLVLLFFFILSLQISTSALAQDDKRIYYGSRAGMQLTTISKVGIGTENAVIFLEHTPSDAKAFCVGYLLDNSMACVKHTMAAVKIGDRVAANCVKKTWTDMFGRNYAFIGKSKKSDVMMVDYELKELKTGEMLNGSGYTVQLEIFKQLCPSLVR